MKRRRVIRQEPPKKPARIDISSLNWDEITRNSSTEDLQYIRGKIDQRLATRPKRTILIRGIG